MRTWICIMLGALLGGCAGPAPGPAGPVYPVSPVRLNALDIQLLVGEQRVVFTNTTAHALQAGRLWLNGWYSAPLGEVGVGQTVQLALTSFVDEHGSSPRGGGFFASEAPEAIVKAELQTAQGLRALVIVSRRR